MKSYSNETGKYQKEFNELFDELIPNMGKAETVNGELLRCANKLYYEFINNGNINSHSENYSIRNDFQEDLNFIFEHIPNSVSLIEEIADIIRYGYDIIPQNINVYDKLMDMVIEHIIKNKS